MPATIRRFDDPLPQVIYLDTSLLMRRLSSGAAPQPAAQALVFLERLEQEALAEHVAPVISDLVVDELCFNVIHAHLGPQLKFLNRRFGMKAGSWLPIFNRHSEILEACRPEIDRLYGFLEGYPVRVLSPRDFELGALTRLPHLAARYVIERFQLLPRDAYHVVYCRLAGADAIATMDPDFSRVDDLTVYAPASLSC
jgi:hypothetical protein